MSRQSLITPRSGTAAQWTAANPVLAASEIGWETDTRSGKVGDGTTAWSSLPYSLGPLGAAAVTPLAGLMPLAVGMDVVDRSLCTARTLGVSNNVVWLSYFYATKTMTVGNLKAVTGTTAAATVTTARMGLYSVNTTNWSITQIAATPNDTTLFAATLTSYTKALTTPVAVTAGQLLAFALIQNATTPATFVGTSSTGMSNAEMSTTPPYMVSRYFGTDLPASATTGGLSGAEYRLYGALLP